MLAFAFSYTITLHGIEYVRRSLYRHTAQGWSGDYIL